VDILPYWSIDLLYALSLFVCRTRGELSTPLQAPRRGADHFDFRILVVSLRFTFERPHITGLLGLDV